MALNKIKLARMEAGLTQKELADKLDVTETQVCRWETGRVRPSYLRLIDIARILRREPEELR